MVSPTALFALYNLLTVWPHGCNGLPVATGVHHRAQTGQTSDWASSHACRADITGVDGESDGIVNIEDMLMVLNYFTCEVTVARRSYRGIVLSGVDQDCGGADMTGPDDEIPDGEVNVSDLLFALTVFREECNGECNGEECNGIGCVDTPCFTSVTCHNQPPPGIGFRCDACPSGCSGDDMSCSDGDNSHSRPEYWSGVIFYEI